MLYLYHTREHEKAHPITVSTFYIKTQGCMTSNDSLVDKLLTGGLTPPKKLTNKYAKNTLGLFATFARN